MSCPEARELLRAARPGLPSPVLAALLPFGEDGAQGLKPFQPGAAASPAPPRAAPTPALTPFPAAEWNGNGQRALPSSPKQRAGPGPGGGEAARLHRDAWESGLGTTAKWILYD